MVNERDLPLVLGFVSDLMFFSQIESVVERLGYRWCGVESPQQIFPGSSILDWSQTAEHVEGQGGQLMALLTTRGPGLIIIDLNNSAIPWEQWIALIKTAPATRRIPILCFGSHRETEKFLRAKKAGANLVLARSRFSSELPQLIQKNISIPDYASLQASCGDQLSEKARKGLEEFNHGEYFEAHESLELAWNEDDTPGKELYRAILQISVAYLQIKRSNYKGAIKMFWRSRQWLDPLPEICRGINVGQLKLDAEVVYAELLALGPDQMHKLDFSLLKPIILLE
jgi:hypothetical protein